MWVARLKIHHDDWILESTLKFNIVARGIPVNSFEKNGRKYHSALVFVQGSEENKKRFFHSLKNNRKVKDYSIKGNQMIALIEGEDAVTHYYIQSLFLIQPVILKKGFEYWEIGSWNRNSLVTFYNQIRKIADVEMLKLKQEMPSVFIQHAVPRLTDKQKNAIELAHELGYYEYPRKVSVEDLAKKANIPRTTFQEHLRKAESKLMNILIEEL
jgi:predicted DNA binding protein